VKIRRLANAYDLDETDKRQRVIPVERNRKLLRINLSRLHIGFKQGGSLGMGENIKDVKLEFWVMEKE